MTCRAGLSPDVSLADALRGIEIMWPSHPISVSIFQTLENWSARLAENRAPSAVEVMDLAAQLEGRLLEDGWCCDDLSDGSIRAFASCDLDQLYDWIEELEG